MALHIPKLFLNKKFYITSDIGCLSYAKNGLNCEVALINNYSHKRDFTIEKLRVRHFV